MKKSGNSANGGKGGKGGKSVKSSVVADDEPPGLLDDEDDDFTGAGNWNDSDTMPELLENSDSDDGPRGASHNTKSTNKPGSAAMKPSNPSTSQQPRAGGTTIGTAASSSTSKPPTSNPASKSSASAAKPGITSTAKPPISKTVPKSTPKPAPKPSPPDDDDDDIPGLVSSGEESDDFIPQPPKGRAAPSSKPSTPKQTGKPATSQNPKPSGRAPAASSTSDKRPASPESSLSTDDEMPLLVPARNGKTAPFPVLSGNGSISEGNFSIQSSSTIPCIGPSTKNFMNRVDQASLGHPTPCFCDSCLLPSLDGPMPPEYRAVGLMRYAPQLKAIAADRVRPPSNEALVFSGTSTGAAYKLSSPSTSIDPDGTTFSPDARTARQLALHVTDMALDALDRGGDLEKTLRTFREQEVERERTVQAMLDARKKESRISSIPKISVERKIVRQEVLLGRKPVRLTSVSTTKTMPAQVAQDGPGSPIPATRPNQASGATKTVSKEDLEAAERYKNEGNEALKRDRFAEAIELYTLAIQLDPTNSVYWSNRAWANLKFENRGSAVADAEKATVLDPKYPKGWFRQGSAYRALGKWKEAHHA
ncbi:hypothetical protein HDU93_003701 [Gonapodya sp. JEL0774]|nr:hypothetical protein HDU93_003701 [Gonapodya sp. JEL0774]